MNYLSLITLSVLAFSSAKVSAVESFQVVPVRLTVYSTVYERDFGDRATELITWYEPGRGVPHQSRFVKGFARRDSIDPVNASLGGAAMEGNGMIDPALHQDDRILLKFLRKGYTNLNLFSWDEETQTAVLELTKSPLGAVGELKHGVSAAVSVNNPYFKMGDWVKLESNGSIIGYRKIDDECSSCEIAHIDLYFDPNRGAPKLPEGPYTATVVPSRVVPKNLVRLNQ